MMWYWGGGVQWWGWLLGLIGMVAFWGLLIWGAWYFFTSAARRPTPPPREEPPDAKRILDERLARGEIDAEEYQRLLSLINGQRPSGTHGSPPVATGGPR